MEANRQRTTYEPGRLERFFFSPRRQSLSAMAVSPPNLGRLRLGRVAAKVLSTPISKAREDLFLALFRERNCRGVEQAKAVVAAAKSEEDTLRNLRKFYVCVLEDEAWCLLTLKHTLLAGRGGCVSGSVAAADMANAEGMH